MSELRHHGILGQKWGIRRFQNPDGSLTAEGKKRYLSDRQVRQVHDTFKNAGYYEDVSDKIFKITGANRNAIIKAREELAELRKDEQDITKKQEELFKGFERDSDERHYYEAISEIASFNSFQDIDSLTLEDYGNASYMGIFEDGQQSGMNAYSMYAYKHGLEKDVDALVQKEADIYKQRMNVAKDYIQAALDEVGGQNLSAYAHTNYFSAAEEIVDRLKSSDEATLRKIFPHDYTTMGKYLLNDASYAANFTDRDKSAIAYVEKISKNLKNNKDKNTWYLLNEAAENLGLSSVKASELSASDWNRINDEIAKLKAAGKVGG